MMKFLFNHRIGAWPTSEIWLRTEIKDEHGRVPEPFVVGPPKQTHEGRSVGSLQRDGLVGVYLTLLPNEAPHYEVPEPSGTTMLAA